MTKTIQYFWITVKTVLEFLTQVFALIAIGANTCLILILMSTENFKIVFNNFNLNGNVALALALMLLGVTMIYLCSNYNNRLISMVAKSFSLSSALYIYKKCVGKYDDSGLILKNKFFSIYHNYTQDEKFGWIARVNKEFQSPLKDLNLSLNDLKMNTVLSFNSYDEFQIYIKNLLVELKRIKTLTLLEKLPQKAEVSSMEYLVDGVSKWVYNHPYLSMSGLLLTCGLTYLYFNGYTLSGIIENINNLGKQQINIKEQPKVLDDHVQIFGDTVQKVIDTTLEKTSTAISSEISLELLLQKLNAANATPMQNSITMEFLDSVFHGDAKDLWKPLFTEELLLKIKTWVGEKVNPYYPGNCSEYEWCLPIAKNVWKTCDAFWKTNYGLTPEEIADLIS